MRFGVILLALLLTLSGCLQFGEEKGPRSYESYGFDAVDVTGTKGDQWPDLKGMTLNVLVLSDHWPQFQTWATQYKSLTGVSIVRQDADSIRELLEDIEDNKLQDIDLILGMDSLMVANAADHDRFQKFDPQLRERIDERVWQHPSNVSVPFMQDAYAFHWDPVHPQLNDTYDPENRTILGPEAIADLFDVREKAHLLTVDDPIKGGPGLSMLYMTIGRFGDDPARYDWQDYWKDLLLGPDIDGDGQRGDDGHANITKTHSISYNNFTKTLKTNAGPSIVWASIPRGYEDSEDGDERNLLLSSRATWNQVWHAAIVDGTRDQAAAEAFLEYLLTDHAQGKFKSSWSYPVVPDDSEPVPWIDIYGAADEVPGNYTTAKIDPVEGGPKLLQWFDAFDKICADHFCRV